MKNDLTRIKKLAISSSLVKNPDVSFLAEGYGNLNYLIEENGVKFVLRIRKKAEKQFNDSLERENSFLRYFEFKGIEFCPKALYYNRENNFLVENFIEGKLVSQKDFSRKQIDLFAKQLWLLFNLDVLEYSNFCKKNNLREFGYRSPLESLKVYGFNRFEEAKKYGLPEDIVEWVSEKLKINSEYLSGLDFGDKKLGFIWGDAQSDMFIDDSGDMTLYDFEHASISASTDLSYIKIHGKFNPSQLDYFIERYCYYSGEDKDAVVRSILDEERIERVNDVVWAAMTWAKTGEEKYKKLTYDRMKLVEGLEKK